MATKKAAGSTKNGRDSQAKRLGVKLFGGQAVSPGNIIIRQRGTKYFPGEGTRMGKDHTIYSVAEGVVKFSEVQMKKFNSQIHKDKVVHVVKTSA